MQTPTHEEFLEMLEGDYKPADLVKVTALRRCSGNSLPGPDRETIVLGEGESKKVPWFVARRWIAKKWAMLTQAPAPRRPEPVTPKPKASKKNADLATAAG